MSKPYQQGSLDGLCGVYALVNAVDFLCGPLSSLQARTLFKQILLHIESKGSLAERCTEGIVINELAGILKFVVCKHYPIKRFKPFHQQPGVSQHHYLQTLSDFLKQPNTIVLLCLEGYYHHWTLIREITETKLVAYDSSGIHYVLQSSCSMKNDHVERRHWLLPAQTYLLKKSR